MRLRPFLGSFAMLAALSAAPQRDGGLSPQLRDAERFGVEGHAAFLLLPTGAVPPSAKSKGEAQTLTHVPWVWYAPTLPKYPGVDEVWMFERLRQSGVAIAGVDVGESYGSPAGRAVYTSFYEHLVAKHGLAPRPCLLARSRGGLMHYAWAAENAQRVAGIAGIYPVCDLRSYPGLAKAAAAFGCAESELARDLAKHNPLDRLSALANAGVPIYHIHGDADRIVPLADNSGALRARYEQLGGDVFVETVAGRGHSLWSGYFRDTGLLDFARDRARSTRGMLPGPHEWSGAAPAETPAVASAGASVVHWVDGTGSRLVPESGDVESGWRFANGVLTASPKWDSVITADSYRDFVMHLEFCVNDVGDAPREKRGNSGVYIQQRYEVQILDSFGVSMADYRASDCGSLYRLKKPDVLACRKAGEWQSYDIAFRAARFQGDQKVCAARISVLHNGKRIHDDYAIPRKTGAGQAESGAAKPIKLQGHQNEVRFRNFWVQRLND
ncbi:MAG: family 16 glycoside hydrolase [Planctomycetota bacterium]